MRFTAFNGDELTSDKGLPPDYTGTVLTGANAFHISGSFGQLVMQEFSLGPLSICHVVIDWLKPERLICYHHYPPVLFSKIILTNSVYEALKGAGRILMNEGQFNIMTGREWTSVLIAEHAGRHAFVNLTWSAEFLNNAWSDFSVFNSLVQHFCRGLPERISGCISDMNGQMKRTVIDLLQTDFTTRSNYSFNELMLKFLRQLLQELRSPESTKRVISEKHRHMVLRGKQLIDDNPDLRFSTPEIAKKTGINEHKLKDLFPKVTGFTIDEYRKYYLFVRAAKKMIQHPDEPLKNISAEAGYPSVTNFIRAFRKMFCCTPKELRNGTWDVTKLFLSKYVCDETQ